ncbi:uracil-DNA glycosylase family protein [Patiriisocius sp. Uisw_017]|jgi:G:T/U-mismatch repair DNA glycosylase|uniref:uracil-DNA glycosylase family protein n=1 Tax=Patiriisocius sp. Uisw_017 TaxID=3230968 RepID=UPI0039E769EA
MRDSELKMFHHTHPYPPFIPPNATKLIVGTLPPPRFTTGDLKEGDVNFCYGSRDGQLWTILNAIFSLGLHYDTTDQAIKQRKDFLINQKIGVCDIVNSAYRQKVDASDIGMQDVELRDVLEYIQQNEEVATLLFTGGNSKNGPEYFFRKLLKDYDLKLTIISDIVPRVYSFCLPRIKGVKNEKERIIKTVSLTAPSGAANRAVGSLLAYKKMKQDFPHKNTIDFRVEQYTPFFI